MRANRRLFLKRGVTAAAMFATTDFTRAAMRSGASVLSEKHFEIADVQRTTVRLSFRPVPERNMAREIPHWQYLELCDVKLKSGIQGTGETMLFYTWGVPSDDDVAKVIGRSAIDMMWDDSLGAGLQMAIFDAIGRAAEVPVHSLLGHKVYQKTPLSWWNIDTSADDMAAECQEAMRLGYRSYKTKGRPWYDVFRQVSAACKVVPESFKIDMDFNDTLRNAEQGIPILRELDKFPQVDIYESPIPQSDVQGNSKICEQVRGNVAMHYGTPTPRTVVESKCCDGFVVGGGASSVMASGKFCEETEMPLWLQLVGAGLTASYSLHFGAVLQQAKWPAVNCHQLFRQDLLVNPILLSDGHAAVPDSPGLGYEVNRDLIAELKVDRPAERPEPERLIETVFGDGSRIYTANNGKVNFMLTAANEDRYPYFEQGADTRLVPNDGTPRWRQLYQKAREQGPFRD